MTAIIVIVLVVVVSGSVFAYEVYTHGTAMAVVQCDYITVPIGAITVPSWSFIITNAGNVGIAVASASILVGNNRTTVNMYGIAAGSGIDYVYSEPRITGVEAGASYPVTFTLIYDNGHTQRINALVQVFPSQNATGAVIVANNIVVPLVGHEATWVYAVGNEGKATIASVSVALGGYSGLITTTLSNITTWSVRSGTAQINTHITSFQVNASYTAYFNITYANGQTEEITSPIYVAS